MTYILSDRTRKLNNIQKLISEMAKEPEEKLVRFCYSEGYTLQRIGDALGVSKQSLKNKYPDLVKGEKS